MASIIHFGTLLRTTDLGPDLKLVAGQLNAKLLSDVYGSIDNIKQLLPPGATFLDGKSAMVDQQPGGLVYYDLSAKRVDLVLTIRVMQLQTFYNRHRIAIRYRGAQKVAKKWLRVPLQVLPF